MTPLRRNRFLWLVVPLALLSLLAVIFTGKKTDGPNFGTVTKGELVQRVTIAGSVTPNRKTLISAPYEGYVKKIYVHVGEVVKPGDPIVSIAQSLRNGDEEVYPLRAPFPGTVVQVLRTEGEYVDPKNSQNNGTSLVRIDDLTRTFVEASAPEIEVGKLRVGQEVTIKASSVLSRSFQGKIVTISLAAAEQRDWDKSRVEFPVVLEVSDNDGQLKSGMSVVVDITTRKLENVLQLRHEFLHKDGDKYFAVTEAGKTVPVEVGLQNEEAFEIKSGLKEGDRLRQTDFLSLIKNP